MKQQEFILQRFDADDGKVFDWADLTEHTHEEIDEDGNTKLVFDHLNAKTIFLSVTDSIENYIEVDE